MGHTYCSSLVHCVFSTKERRNLVPDELQPALWAYMGGIARKNGFHALQVGGTANHCHLLVSLPPSIALSKAIQLMKGASSKWIKARVPGFEWQEGYGAFSIGVSQVGPTLRYIVNQQVHHKRRSFEQEFLEFLKRHKLDYDPKFVLG
jgi:REP element-mobilizing transposase RayT